MMSSLFMISSDDDAIIIDQVLYNMNCRPWRLLAIVVFSSSAAKLEPPQSIGTQAFSAAGEIIIV